MASDIVQASYLPMSGATDSPSPLPAVPSAGTAYNLHTIVGILFHPSNSDNANVRIMISAVIVLFAVIIFILGLHLYAKCSCRNVQSHHRIYQLEFMLSEAVESEQNVGLDKAGIESLPTFIYKRGLMTKGVECAVCLSEFEEKEGGRLLPKCNHVFHIECIGTWFKSHSTCPLCRLSVLPLTSRRLDHGECTTNPQSSRVSSMNQMSCETVVTNLDNLENLMVYEEGNQSQQQAVRNDQQGKGRSVFTDLEALQSSAVMCKPGSRSSSYVVSQPEVSGSEPVR
ncbi:hypothetical protein O6H91_08G047600 [Diphasiastrum complanatum]|nr:hypothetical protein O6H91_08G047600 [Diphasiastrum complanatum]